MGFYEKYIETVTKNDARTRNSVDAIIGRMDELLEDRPDGRLSGLVVGRVQSGKTRNYVGLALKARIAAFERNMAEMSAEGSRLDKQIAASLRKLRLMEK